jgi:cytochrome c1
MVFFACEGLVAMLDERAQDEEYIVVTPTDFKARAEGLAVTGKLMAKGNEKWMRSDGREYLAAANDMIETVKEAQSMGDPSDPLVRAYWARHRRNDTIRVQLSPGSDVAGYPELPDIPLGKFTGQATDPGDPLETAGAILIDGGDATKIRRKPRKKPRKGGLVLSSDSL